MEAPRCIRAPAGPADTLSQQQIDRYLSLLSAADQQVVCSSTLEDRAREHVETAGGKALSGDALRDSVLQTLSVASALQDAIRSEFDENEKRLSQVLAAYRLTGSVAGDAVEPAQLAAFVRFCIAYRIHCYFETSLLPAKPTNGHAAPAAAPAAAPNGKPQVVLVLGGSGSGKATQCARIARTFGYAHLCVAALLQEEAARPESEHKEAIEASLQSGELVAADVVVSLISGAMQGRGWTGGKFLVDGLLQGTGYLEAWERLLGDEVEVKFALLFECSDACMEERVLGRGRPGDDGESIRKRLEAYRRDSLAVVAQLEASGRLRRVNTEQTSIEVWRSVRAVFAPTVVFVLGGPGAGKGTVSKRISETFGYKHLSAGDLLRSERTRPGSELGAMIETCIREGRLVPAELTVRLLLQAMQDGGWEGGKYLVDGFPRSLDNLAAWNAAVEKRVVVRFCLFLSCSEGVMEARLLDRGKTSGRSDDNIESIRKRFMLFHSDSLPVVKSFASEGKLRRVDAEQSVEAVWRDVQALFAPSVVFVLGGPGVGKGTQCKRIVEMCGYRHLSAGDLLRAERERPGSEIGGQIEACIKEGKLVPVEVTVGLLVKAMEASGWEDGRYLVDGFPRSVDNWEGWCRVVGSRVRVRFAIALECSEEVMEARLLERGKTSGRADDNMDSIRKRFALFKSESLPVLDLFKSKGLLRRVDAGLPTEAVWSNVRKLFAPTVVFVLGSPGAGKATLCSRIPASSGFQHLSAGDLLREECNNPGSDLGEGISAHLSGGTLVPAATIVELLRKAMERRGWEGGRYLIDGFPRNVENFEAWQTTLGERVNLKCVLLLQVSEEVTLQRRLRQAKTSGRSDDNPETIQKRISLYAEASKALTDRLLQQGLLHTINAEQSPDDVWSCAQEVLHNELDVHIRNQAVVILKPHACNADAERFVKSYLASHNVAVVKMGRLSAEDLASRNIFSEQYTHILRCASASPSSLQLAEAAKQQFEKAYGVTWEAALGANEVMSAAEASEKLGLSHAELFEAWKSSSTTRLTPHAQVARVEAGPDAQPGLVVNGFAPHWRDTFASSGAGATYFVVEFDPAQWSWRRFRNDVVGSTNPARALPDSMRGAFYREWAAVGLQAQPNTLNNCVHASEGPLEALRERMLWAEAELLQDPFARLLLSHGISQATLEAWLGNPFVEQWPVADAVGDATASGPLFECTAKADSAGFRDASLAYVKRRQAEFGEEGLVAWTMLARQRPAKMERLVSRTGSEAPSEAQEAPASRITVLHFNDVYNVEPREKEPVGGLARFVTRIKELKAESVARGEPEALVLFSGDAFNPSLTSTTTFGEHMVTGLNFVGIDTACYGNHDFDFGVDQLVKMAGETNFPWLISNVTDKATGRPLAEGLQTRMIDFHGRKIGFIGLVEREWLVTLATINPEDVEFEDFCECGHRLARQLKQHEGAEIVIALTHMRVPNDELLAHTVADIDVILGGHDHHYEVKPVGPHGIYVLKSGTDFRDITVLQLEFLSEPGADGKSFRVGTTEHAEIVSSIAEDPDVKVFVDECVSKVGAAMDKVIGETAEDLDCRFTSIRTMETNVGNFVTDIMRKALNADIALLNSGTLRADAIFERGVLKMRDLVNLLPMLDELCLLQLSGEQLLAVLENSVSQYPRLEGRFAQVSGVTFSFDAAQPAGKRLLRDTVKVGEGAIDASRKYKLCTKDYLRQGKDGYDAFREAMCIADGEQAGILPSIVRDYFQHLSTLNGEGEAAPKSTTEWAGRALAEGTLARVGDGPEPMRRFAIRPKVEGRIVCLNPVAA